MSVDAGGVVYLDASALVKLVLPEAESDALVRELQRGSRELITSIVGAIETRRAVLAAGGIRAGRAGGAIDEVLETTTLIGVTHDIRDLAGMLRPPLLRTLDAIHLATALSFGTELESFVAYDRRLAEAARAAGLVLLQPA